jgi:hypothetical protein
VNTDDAAHVNSESSPFRTEAIVSLGSTAAVRRPDRLFHWVLLIVSVCVLAVAGVLRVEGGDRVVLPLINQPIPGVCTYKSWFGVCCPGCGLTRCFISLAHGEWSAAWRFNPVGILLFAVAFAQLPLRSWQLFRIRRGQAEIRFHRLSTWIFWGLFVGLIGQWVVRTFVLGMNA